MSIEKKCKTCKWWTGDPWDQAPPGRKSCEQPKAMLGYQWEPDDIPADGVHVENDEGWGWYMGPEFGCVNWEVAP